MEENEYRSTYHAINPLRCVFEKSLLTRRCHCELSSRFCLADREGIACSSVPTQAHCRTLLNQLRENARFALKLTTHSNKLPHGKEIKVQNGGLLGLQAAIHPQHAQDREVADIASLVSEALLHYGALDKLPYEAIVRSIVSFQGRQKRPRLD